MNNIIEGGDLVFYLDNSLEHYETINQILNDI